MNTEVKENILKLPKIHNKLHRKKWEPKSSGKKIPTIRCPLICVMLSQSQQRMNFHQAWLHWCATEKSHRALISEGGPALGFNTAVTIF